MSYYYKPYRIRITRRDFLNYKPGIRDCVQLAGEVTSSSQSELSILRFIEQFYDVDTRWPKAYEKLTLEFLKKCAGLQAATICKVSCDLGMPSRVLIALSLRCLTLTREVRLFKHSMEKADCDAKNLVKDKTSDGSDIEILKLQASNKHASHTHDRIHGKSISQSLEELLQLTQNLMMRRRPQDSPIVLCTLCLLCMITENYISWVPDLVYDDLPDSVYDALKTACGSLCAFFDTTSKSLQPLCNKWDKEAYSRLVDGNDVLVGTFQWMHDQWLNGAYKPPAVSLIHKVDAKYGQLCIVGWEDDCSLNEKIQELLHLKGWIWKITVE